MPLDPSIFYNFAALNQRQNEQLLDNIKTGFDTGYKNQALKVEKTKAEAAGLDLEKLAVPALIKMQAGQELDPQETAILKAWDATETRKLAPDAAGNYRKVNASIFGSEPIQGFDLGNIPQSAPQKMPDTFAGGTSPAMSDAQFDAIQVEPLPVMDGPLNTGTLQDALPVVPKQAGAFDLNAVAPIVVPPELQGNPNAAQKYIEAAATAQVDAGKAGAVEAAKLQAEKTAGKPKAEAALIGASEKAENIDQTINDAIGMISPQTAGMGSAIKDIPLVGKGSKSKDLASLLETIGADSAFSELQTMRDNSKTGGALGSITERELALLQNAAAALNQDQSPAQLKSNLKKYQTIRKRALERAYEAFEKDNGYRPQSASPAPAQKSKSWQEYFK